MEILTKKQRKERKYRHKWYIKNKEKCRERDREYRNVPENHERLKARMRETARIKRQIAKEIEQEQNTRWKL